MIQQLSLLEIPSQKQSKQLRVSTNGAMRIEESSEPLIPSKAKRRIRKPIEMIKASDALLTKNMKTVAEIVRLPEPKPHPMMSDPRYLDKISKWKKKHHIEESGMDQEQSIKFGDFLEKLLLEWDGKK